MRTAWVISIGTELSLGQSVDTNSAWLAAQLAALGVRTLQHRTVPDELELIVAALRDAAAAADVVLVTGGLGPTEDDLTRQALADAIGEPLVRDEPSLERIRAFFARRGKDMPERNSVQALRPASAAMIDNPNGTAPGLRAVLAGRPVYVMPGVPREMKPMFTDAILPELRARTGGAQVLKTRILHCAGRGESEIGELIRDLMARGRNPEIGTTADAGLVGIRINAAADSPPAADALLDAAEQELRQRLGDTIYGRDGQTLAAVVGALLHARGRTLATAESCTGGWIGKLLTDVAGSSAWYLGGVVAYSNASKVRELGVPAELIAGHGAVSEPVAAAMASGVRERFGADFALSVTGIAGPGGGSESKPVGLVFIGEADAAGVRVRAHQMGDAERAVIRIRAALAALNGLRLRLLRD